MIVFPDLGKYGRLKPGNQLWQIASTIGLAFRDGEKCLFPADWSYRPWFSVPDRFFSHNPQGTPAYKLCMDVDERHRPYLQDYSYWAAHADFIREILAPSPQALKILDDVAWFEKLGPDKIALHVRRGDFLVSGPQYYPVASLDYYREALAMLPELPVVVFSDDVPWCKAILSTEVLAGREHDFYDGVTRPKEHEPSYNTAPVLDWIDLLLASRCSKVIGSNSTYAFWMAFLSGDPVPIFPKAWYGPVIAAYADESKLFPEGWVRI